LKRIDKGEPQLSLVLRLERREVRDTEPPVLDEEGVEDSACNG
jgi:hypothetical protein